MDAIKNAPPPSTVKDVRSFIGLATYCSKFIHNFSDLSQPLRELTKKNMSFKWTSEHQKSFQAIKSALTSTTVMAYFDKGKATQLVTDALPTGLSAILSQTTLHQDDRTIVAYISLALTDVERRYSQTEREALAIVWAMERLHIYLYGGHFTLLTDCKQIQMILNNPISKPPARIERWNLRIQDFDFDIQYIKGPHNPSDFLSRHPIVAKALPDTEFEDTATRYLNFIIEHTVPKAMTLENIKLATTSDSTMQYLTKLIQSNQWHSLDSQQQSVDSDVSLADRKLFRNVRDELSVDAINGLILRGSRIVLPAVLRRKALNIAHEGHQGLVKTKKLLREKVWFPGIDALAKEVIGSCLSCQVNSPESPPEPLHMTTLPPAPWHTLNIDVCGPLPGGVYLLVVIDVYSRFLEVEIVNSTSAAVTIPKLERIFATHGLPLFIKSDNGPPFPGRDFYKFMTELGVTHKPSSPLWPQGNAEVERFMQPLQKCIRSAHSEGRDWKRAIFKFLLNFRATPHATTGKSPASLLFNRDIHTKLPNLITSTNSVKHRQLEQTDSAAKAKMKTYADNKHNAKPSNIAIGNTVLVRQNQGTKFTTRYQSRPFKVTQRKGNRVTAERNGKYITRNVSFFKKYEHAANTTSEDEDFYDFDSFSEQQCAQENEPRYPSRLRNRVERYGQNIYDS